MSRDNGNWRDALAARLPLYGHRNWIVVADAAYPAQARDGIETIATGGGQLEVVEAVLAALDASRHVRPLVYTDEELAFVGEKDAPGANDYRASLAALLAGRPLKPLPHEEIIAMLDEAGVAFRVLILKSTLAIPYTSVFFELDCGYWSGEAEQRLRAAMEAGR